MSENKQLVRKNNGGGYNNVYPYSFTETVKDKKTGKSLEEILAGTNFLYLPYRGSKAATRLQVDERYRRKGLWVQYVSDLGSVIVEYYNNNDISDTKWVDDRYWVVYNSAQFNPGTVGLDALSQEAKDYLLTNSPVNTEDITRDNQSRLQLADRAYNPAAFSGKGYKILRQNILNSKNVLAQSMILSANTVYEIRYDYDLQGQEISIPDSCILKFNGGSISNGKIKYNNTILVGFNMSYYNIEAKGVLLNYNVYVEYYGAIGDGINDDSICIQNAIDSVCNNNNKTLLFTNKYYITIPINCTNTREDGTINRDGLKLKGKNYIDTVIICNTGDTYASLETTGSQWMVIEDIKFTSRGDLDNPAKVLIYQGIGKILPQTQNQVFNRVYLEASNYALINFGAEENSYKSCYFTSYNSIILTTLNPSSIISSHVEQLDSHSLGVLNFQGENFIQNFAEEGAILSITDTNSLNIDGCYFNGGDKLLQVNGNNINLHIHGTVESCKHVLYIIGKLHNSDINLTLGGFKESASLIQLVNGLEGVITNSKINFYITQETNRELFELLNIFSFQNFSGYLSNTTININEIDNYIKIPTQILQNNRTNNVVINGLNGHYKFNNGYNQDFYNSNLNDIGINSNKVFYVGTINYGYTPNGLGSEGNHISMDISIQQVGAYTQINTEYNRFCKIELFINRGENSNIYNIQGFVIYDRLFKRLVGINNNTEVIEILYKYDKDNSELHLFAKVSSHESKLRGNVSIHNASQQSVFNSSFYTYKKDINIEEDLNSIIKSIPINSFIENIDNYNSENIPKGTNFYDYVRNKPYWWNGTNWVTSDGNNANFKSQGIFNQKPSNPSIGFAYFCTDKQTSEGATNGIMIYHKGNNVWVDALGRVVS